MPAWWSYLRSHPWQRRLLTGSVMLVLGSVTALVALPHVRDYLLLRDLLAEKKRSAALGDVPSAVVEDLSHFTYDPQVLYSERERVAREILRLMQ